MNCYCCGGAVEVIRRIRFGPDRGTEKDLVQCGACGHASVHPLIPFDYGEVFASYTNYTDYPHKYGKEHSRYDTLWGRNVSNLFLLQMFSHITDETVILEIGPGPGGLFRELRRAGHAGPWFAFEPCRNFKKHLKNLGVRVFDEPFVADTSHCFTEAASVKAGIIISANQIYFNHDPLEQLQLMADLLAPGGLLLALVMNSHALASNIKESDNVMHWFSPESFRKLLSSTRLDILFQSTSGQFRSELANSSSKTSRPGYQAVASTARLIGLGVEIVNRVVMRLRKTEAGPFIYTPRFSPALAMVENHEFRYGGPDRYQLKALLRKPFDVSA